MKSRPLRELAALFQRLGTTAFGGPAAHIAMMEDEVVLDLPSTIMVRGRGSAGSTKFILHSWTGLETRK